MARRRYPRFLIDLARAFEACEKDAQFALHDALIETGFPQIARSHFPPAKEKALRPCEVGECIVIQAILWNLSLRREEERCREWNAMPFHLQDKAKICKMHYLFRKEIAVSYDKAGRCEGCLAKARFAARNKQPVYTV